MQALQISNRLPKEKEMSREEIGKRHGDSEDFTQDMPAELNVLVNSDSQIFDTVLP